MINIEVTWEKWKYVSLAGDVVCSGGRRRARAKLGGVSASCVFRTLPRPVFWQLLPATVIEGRAYRRPSINTDKGSEKKKFFDQAGSEWSRQASLSQKAKVLENP